MNTVQPRMTNLFEQLGLDSSELGISQFIKTHQLPSNMNIIDAHYWSEGQRQFLYEKIKADDTWALIVDQLNESLHEEATQSSLK